MEVRALLSPTTQISSQLSFNFLIPINFADVNKTNGKELLYRDWEIVWYYVSQNDIVRNEIKRKLGYITGLSTEDLIREAYVVGMETLRNCRRCYHCQVCFSVNCKIWKREFFSSFRKTLRKLQDLKKKNGRISYFEIECEEENGNGFVEKIYPTSCRSDWDIEQNWTLDPLMILCSQLEEQENEKKHEEKIEKILEAVKGLKKKERQVWELLLSGMSPRDVAKKLGYKRVHGIYVLIRRSARKIRKLLA
jgi:DNA-directed RNA polymerase specialized sigma24 family protein